MLYKEYRCPKNLPEALALLGSAADARPIAGGTDLMVQLEARTAKAGLLVDISRLPELQEITLSRGQVRIGAAVTYQAIIDSPVVQREAPLLVEASRQVGAAQVQHMGTLGGNIANASPAGDLLPPLYALDARLVLAGPGGERELPVADFILGVRRTALRPAELITAICIPARSSGEGGSFVKFGLRQSQVISVVSVACRLQSLDGVIQAAALALGAVGPTVLRARRAEQLLSGRPAGPLLFEQAGEAARQDACPIDDIRGSAAFRRHLVGPLVQRALQAAWERACPGDLERE